MHWVAHKGRIGGYQREVVNLLRGGVTGDSSSNHLRELGMSSWLGGLYRLRAAFLAGVAAASDMMTGCRALFRRC